MLRRGTDEKLLGRRPSHVLLLPVYRIGDGRPDRRGAGGRAEGRRSPEGLAAPAEPDRLGVVPRQAKRRSAGRLQRAGGAVRAGPRHARRPRGPPRSATRVGQPARDRGPAGRSPGAARTGARRIPGRRFGDERPGLPLGRREPASGAGAGDGPPRRRRRTGQRGVPRQPGLGPLSPRTTRRSRRRTANRRRRGPGRRNPRTPRRSARRHEEDGRGRRRLAQGGRGLSQGRPARPRRQSRRPAPTTN